jgi:type III secretory pathway component EscT
MTDAPGLLRTLTEALELGGVDLRAWGLAWARVAPTIALVPAFGLRAIPAPARIALGLALAAGIAPALTPLAASPMPWPALLMVEAAKGLPVALTAASALWVATMTGGVVDNLRGGRERANLPTVEQGATPMGVLFSMLVAIAFLESGGPARVAEALSAPGLQFHAPLAHAAIDLAHGIELAVAVAAPVLAASIVVEVGGALVARAASPAFIQPLLWPLRSVAILGVTAIVFTRIAELLALYAHSVP